jgi:hypothetical protein
MEDDSLWAHHQQVFFNVNLVIAENDMARNWGVEGYLRVGKHGVTF